MVEKNVQIDQKVIFQGKGTVHLGEGVTLGYGLGGSPTIPILLQPRDKNSIIEIGSGGKIAPITIGNNVWLGLGVTILKGVTIGDDSVVGAGGVVTKDIPDGGIAAGNPIKIIGSVYEQ